MRRMSIACAALALSVGAAAAAGFLAQRPEKLPALELGTGDTGYGVSRKDYNLETGKAYTFTLKSTGKKECAWEAPEFSNNIWLRKIEVSKVEIKSATFYEIEMEREGEAEIVFVPIRPGEYNWRCRGLESKGMTGKFIVK